MALSLLILGIVVSAQIDSTELWIGDQTQLHLSAATTGSEEVVFPQYGEMLTDGLEIVARTEKDTAKQADGSMVIRQDLTITAFKDSLFFVPPIPFVSGGDTIYTQSLSLNVIQPFEIDSTANAITDIKPIYKAPIWWWGILRWVLLAIGIAGLGTGIYFLVRYIRKKIAAKGETAQTKPELLRPADEVALERLDKIKEQKLWQQGRTKEYYTELTDVLRYYMARRFEVTTQEKTSEEILVPMKALLERSLYDGLKKVLTLADLVKFAKWHPEAEENEQALRFAYHFVEDTAQPVQENQAETIDGKNPDTDTQS